MQRTVVGLEVVAEIDLDRSRLQQFRAFDVHDDVCVLKVVIAHERLVQQNGLTSLHLTSTESERVRERERE